MSEEKVDELLGALRLVPGVRDFAQRTMAKIAAAEQARRMKQMVWSLVGASALSVITTSIVIMTGLLRVGDLTASFALFASHAIPWLRLLVSTFQAAPVLAIMVLVPAIGCCAVTTLLLERSVRARA